MVLKILNHYSYSFHLISAKLDEDMATMAKYRLLLVLAIGQIKKKCCFEILTWDPMANLNKMHIIAWNKWV